MLRFVRHPKDGVSTTIDTARISPGKKHTGVGSGHAVWTGG